MERGCAEWQNDFWAAVDGELAPAESAALAGHIRSCAVCREAVGEAVATHRHLLEAADCKTQLVRREAAMLGLKDAAPADSPATTGAPPVPVLAPKNERERARVIFIDWRVIATAAVVALTVLAWSTQDYWRRRSGPPIDMSPMAPMATVESVSGTVTVINEDFSSHKSAKKGQFLTAKEGLEIKGAGFATLRLRDGSMLTLKPEQGSCRFWAHAWSGSQPGPLNTMQGVAVSLERGVLDARVARQFGSAPMSVATPQAGVKIVGTVFRLIVVDKSTRLEVSEGRVQFTRRADRKMVEVGEKEFCVADLSGPMTVQKMQ